ncbi:MULTISPECIES: hypothetical protein [unclassified Bartonella]
MLEKLGRIIKIYGQAFKAYKERSLASAETHGKKIAKNKILQHFEKAFG